MTKREHDLIKEAVARTRFELGWKAQPPGPDSWRAGHGGSVTVDEARAITAYVRAARDGDLKAMRRFGVRDD